MSKRSRWEECRGEFFASIEDGTAPSRETLKRWGANKVAGQRDRLAERATYCAKNFALGGLQSVCWLAGKNSEWIGPRIYALCDKRPELTLYPYSVRVCA